MVMYVLKQSMLQNLSITFVRSIAQKLVNKWDKCDFDENRLKDPYQQKGVDNNGFYLKSVNVIDVWKRLRSFNNRKAYKSLQ